MVLAGMLVCLAQQASAAVPAERVQQLLASTGVAAVLEQAPLTLNPLLREMEKDPQLDVQVAHNARVRLRTHLAAATLYQKLINQLAASLQPDLANSLAVVFRDPFVAQMRTAERGVLQGKNRDHYREYLEKLKQVPPPARRLTLMKELDAMARTGDLVQRIRVQVYKQYLYELHRAQYLKALPEESLEIAMGSRKAAIEQQAHQDVLNFMLFAYLKFPDADIGKYRQFYANADYQRWMEQVLAALDTVFVGMKN